MQVYVRRQSIIFEYQVPQLHTDNNLFHFTELRFQDFRLLLYIFLSLSDCITVSIGIADCSSLKYSLTCKCEKGTEQKGAGIRWWLIVRDVMSAPFFSALLSVCFLSQCFSTEPNPTSATQKPFQDGMIKTETNVAVAPLS